MSEKFIGIDLGTTNTCASILLDGKVKLIPTLREKFLLPSAVFFDKTDIFVGEDAVDQQTTKQTNFVKETKRLMGQSYSNAFKNNFACDVVPGPTNNAVLSVEYMNKTLRISPEEIAALILTTVRVHAEKMLKGEIITKAVVTIPAHFNNPQREATLNAGKLAGFTDLYLITEPAAAALCYIDKLDLNENREKYVLVYDLGGGTTDVSIVKFEGTSVNILGINGESTLGGIDFTKNLVDFILKEICSKYPTIKQDDRLLRRIFSQAEVIKVELSSFEDADLELFNPETNTDISMTITRKQFEEINEDLFAKTIDIVDECVHEAKLEKSTIDEIILAGGSSRIPKLEEMLKDYFNQKVLNRAVNPDEAIAIGAGIQAARYSADPRQKCTKYFITEVLPTSLGIETFGGKMSFVLRKNTKLPAKQSRMYTNQENQSKLTISIYSGENEFVENNVEIATLSIGNITPAEAKTIRIDVTFNVDENGILNVEVKEDGKNLNSLEIKLNTGGFTMDDIKNLEINDSDTSRSISDERSSLIYEQI